MSINWPAWISSFNDPAKSKVIGKMEFTTLPAARKAGQAEIGNWLIAIPRDSQNAEAALDFLLWATSCRTDEAFGANAAIRRRANRSFAIRNWWRSFPLIRRNCVRWKARVRAHARRSGTRSKTPLASFSQRPTVVSCLPRMQ